MNKGLFVFLSGGFLRIGLLVFSETQHDVRGLCGVVEEGTRFFEKNTFVTKMVKMVQ